MIAKLQEMIMNLVDAQNGIVLLIVLIAVAVAILLMFVFMIAMLVNHAKLKKAQADDGESAKLKKEYDALKKADAAKDDRIRALQEKSAAAEAGKQESERLYREQQRLNKDGDAAKSQLVFYDKKFDELKKRAEEASKEAEALQKDNDRLKAQLYRAEAQLSKATIAKESVKAEAATAKKEATIAKKEPAAVKSAAEKDADSSGIYDVVYDKERLDWVVKKRGGQRATQRFRTKEEALKRAKELAENQDASLSVRKKDGKFQKQ